MDKIIGTPPSLEEKKAFPNSGNKEMHVFNLYFHLCYNSSEVYEMTVPIYTSHWCLVMSFWLKVFI